MKNESVEKRIKTMIPILSERQKRIYLATEAESLGWGGKGIVSSIAGVDKNTLTAGQKDLDRLRKESADGKIRYARELKENSPYGLARSRRPGAGRKPIEEKQPGITLALQSLISGGISGGYGEPLSWTARNVQDLLDELHHQGFSISYTKVRELLAADGYSFHSGRRLRQAGLLRESCEEQYRYINETCRRYMAEKNPVVAVSCRKETGESLSGNSRSEDDDGRFALDDSHEISVNSGCAPDTARQDKALNSCEVFSAAGQDRPPVSGGTSDMAAHDKSVNTGILRDTADFAAHSISSWWSGMGRERFPKADRLYIVAEGDEAGSHVWQPQLQSFADRTGLTLDVSCLPPGISKWAGVEHRLVSVIREDWSGRPSEALEITVALVAPPASFDKPEADSAADVSARRCAGTASAGEGAAGTAPSHNKPEAGWNHRFLPRD